jgi:hypothetical protein
MKYAMGMLCALVAGVASAEQVLVRADKGHQCVGDAFLLGDVPDVLFLERACELPVSRAAERHAYVSRSEGAEVRGCWRTLSDGNYSVIDEAGGQQLLNMDAYAEAETTSSSSARIVRSPAGACP